MDGLFRSDAFRQVILTAGTMWPRTINTESDVTPTRDGAPMTRIAGGIFHMGADDQYPEEAPVHIRRVETFWIDLTPVTNALFARFVAQTGHVTLAERTPDPAAYPDADPALLVPGSLVFVQPSAATDLLDGLAWWRYLPGASWRCPQGPGSSIAGLDDHPVVHVALADALAYAAWAGKDLPTEAEWEYAARGGLDRAEFAWGNELMPGARHMANTWQGRFPFENLSDDGYVGTSPVTAFPCNGYGVFDMIGNVWEWTKDSYRATHAEPPPARCCSAKTDRSSDLEHMVVKGGSHLCAPNHCRRYRPAARQSQSIDTSSTHIGFRCVTRDPQLQ
ncbi:formylglycine-generating enzyme family protein [Tabrizicola sp. BL-A-41-H6]|uniref:formylglycine-generating enzyme family protein n=1 Tax=Tabrizicola sp. BL-A-41-H6 TaxID=3421107 RepID=UPI003D67FF55